MSRKFEVWLDSGANHASCRSQVVSLDEVGVTSEAWDGMDDDEKDEVMREIAWDRMDWGYRELE